MDQKMARVDISLILTRKIGKIKKGKYTYIIYSKDFPKSAGNPSCVSAEVEETTGNRLAPFMSGSSITEITPSIPAYDPYR